MRRFITLLGFCLFAFCASAAQQDSYAYGQPSDLKGLKKLYVDTGTDTKSRDSIIKALEKSKLGFEVVDDEKDAEILLSFGAGEVVRKVVGSVTDSVFEARAKAQRTGSGLVIANHVRGRNRMVLSFKDTQKSKWERTPSTNFTREFIKAYKEGNDLR